MLKFSSSLRFRQNKGFASIGAIEKIQVIWIFWHSCIPTRPATASRLRKLLPKLFEDTFIWIQSFERLIFVDYLKECDVNFRQLFCQPNNFGLWLSGLFKRKIFGVNVCILFQILCQTKVERRLLFSFATKHLNNQYRVSSLQICGTLSASVSFELINRKCRIRLFDRCCCADRHAWYCPCNMNGFFKLWFRR